MKTTTSKAETGLIVERVPIDTLHLDPANARRHPDRNLAAIKASLARFGQVKPIVVDSNNVVRAGNGTLAAAIELGWEQVDITRTKLTGSEATAYAIADNRTAELAEWDDQALRGQLAALKDEGFDLDAAGFDLGEVEALLGGLIAGEEAPDGEGPRDDDPPRGAPARPPVTGRFGVIVECDGEEDQREVYERLTAEGLTCRVVCV